MGSLRVLSATLLVGVLHAMAACKPKPVPVETTARLVSRNGVPAVVIDVVSEANARVEAIGTPTIAGTSTNSFGKARLEGNDWNPDTGAAGSYDLIVTAPDGRRGNAHATVDERPAVFASPSFGVRCVGPKRCRGTVAKDLTITFSEIEDGAEIDFAGGTTKSDGGRAVIMPGNVFEGTRKPVSAIWEKPTPGLLPITIRWPTGQKAEGNLWLETSQYQEGVNRFLLKAASGGVRVPGDETDPESRRAIVMIASRSEPAEATLYGHAAKASEIDFVGFVEEHWSKRECRERDGTMTKILVVNAEITIVSRRTGAVVSHEKDDVQPDVCVHGPLPGTELAHYDPTAAASLAKRVLAKP